MIISHKHKFIFIKPQKTAGTSIELLLSRVCGDADVITPLGFDPDPKVREKNHAKNPQNYQRRKPLKQWELRELYKFLRKGKMPNLNYWEHLSAEKIREYAGEKIWNNYLKISIVRNPWDHAVSQHNWLHHYGYASVTNNFRDFLLNKYKTLWQFYTVRDMYNIDFMIRFENLSEDFKEVKKLLGIDLADNIPVTKNNTRKVNSYNEFFNEETAHIVREKNICLLTKFGYEF